MKRSSSLPQHKSYANGLNYKLPKITKNPWVTNSSTASDYKYMRGEKYLPQNYMIMNRDKLKTIENNYFEMRYLLNDKINRLEKNQRKFNDILQYSLEQNRLQNDINSFNYDKHIQNYKDKNKLEKEYLINVINQMPQMIESKIDKIFMDEYESSQNQKQFLENLKERMISELKNQRRYDYIKYKQQLNELMKLKENEEKEKIQLMNEIQNQKLKFKIKAIKYQNQMYRYNNPYPAGLPFYPIIQPPNQPQSIGSSIDEFMKLFLFKEMMGSYQKYNDYQNYLYDFLPNIYSGLGDSKSFREYQEFKNRRNKRKLYRSQESNDPYSKRYKYEENGGYSSNANNVPFINTGKSYSKIKASNNNNKMRFMTSHNSVNNEDIKKSKKKEKEKKLHEISESKKSKKKLVLKETESKESKTSKKQKSSGSGGSENTNEDNSDNDSNTEDKNDTANGQEKKDDNEKKEEKKESESKEEEKKRENESDDDKNDNNHKNDDDDNNDEDDDDDNNNDEKKEEEGQQPQSNQPQSNQPQTIQQNQQPQ